MVALGGQAILRQGHHMLGTGPHAQLAAFAIDLVDFNGSLNGHSFLRWVGERVLMIMTHVKNEDTFSLIYYRLVTVNTLVSSITKGRRQKS
jgi:hypothetical protein